MYANGVSHQIVTDELKGIQNLLTWLAFVPARRGLRPPHLDMFDSAERDIDFVPVRALSFLSFPLTSTLFVEQTEQPYDPRHLLVRRRVGALRRSTSRRVRPVACAPTTRGSPASLIATRLSKRSAAGRARSVPVVARSAC